MSADDYSAYGDPAVEVHRASMYVLPDGWTMHVDEASGFPMYHCAATGETQWEPPDGTVDHGAAEAASAEPAATGGGAADGTEHGDTAANGGRGEDMSIYGDPEVWSSHNVSHKNVPLHHYSTSNRHTSIYGDPLGVV